MYPHLLGPCANDSTIPNIASTPEGMYMHFLCICINQTFVLVIDLKWCDSDFYKECQFWRQNLVREKEDYIKTIKRSALGGVTSYIEECNPISARYNGNTDFWKCWVFIVIFSLVLSWQAADSDCNYWTENAKYSPNALSFGGYFNGTFC